EIRLEIMKFSVVFALCAVPMAMLLTISLMCWRRYPTTLVSERGSRKLRTLPWWIAFGLLMGVWSPLIKQLEAAYDLVSYLIKGWELIVGSIFLFALLMGLIGFVRGAVERRRDEAIFDGLVAGHDGSRKTIHEHLHTLKTARGRARYVAWLDGERFVPTGDWPGGWPPNFLDAASSHLAKLEQRWSRGGAGWTNYERLLAIALCYARRSVALAEIVRGGTAYAESPRCH